MVNQHYYYAREIDDDRIILEGAESKHCIRVMRHRKGDQIDVLDGNGSIYRCILYQIESDRTILIIEEKMTVERQRDYYLHVAIGPTKNMNRFEMFIEKATEIGIDRITPVISKNSERNHLRKERLEQIMISAIKQSGQAILPVLAPPQPIGQFLSGTFTGQKFIAHCLDPEIPLLSAYPHPSKEVTLMIGPEGGYDPAEVQQATRSGFQPVSLGNTRLRTETAGIVAVTVIHQLFQS